MSTVISGVDFVALQVLDLDASRDFYVEKIGLVPARQSPPGAVVFDTQPIPFAIRTPLVDLSATDKLGWGTAIWLHCEDSAGLHSQLVERGVRIVQPVTPGPFGNTFSFEDPDGYVLTVHDHA